MSQTSPFGDTPAEVKNRAASGSKEIPPDIFAVMESFKPYKGGQASSAHAVMDSRNFRMRSNEMLKTRNLVSLLSGELLVVLHLRPFCSVA